MMAHCSSTILASPLPVTNCMRTATHVEKCEHTFLVFFRHKYLLTTVPLREKFKYFRDICSPTDRKKNHTQLLAQSVKTKNEMKKCKENSKINSED